jgi:hypothetical protein
LEFSTAFLGSSHTRKNCFNDKGKEMNAIVKICWATVVAVALITLTVPAQAEVKTKEVCKDVVDKNGKPVKNKDGSTKQACKTIKVHKKLEGTPVPPPKK